jgi:hypothetical protein
VSKGNWNSCRIRSWITNIGAKKPVDLSLPRNEFVILSMSVIWLMDGHWGTIAEFGQRPQWRCQTSILLCHAGRTETPSSSLFPVPLRFSSPLAFLP